MELVGKSVLAGIDQHVQPLSGKAHELVLDTRRLRRGLECEHVGAPGGGIERQRPYEDLPATLFTNATASSAATTRTWLGSTFEPAAVNRPLRPQSSG